ncbi:MAG: hypothetical protein CVU97_07410 [Firmicutes bacterium HGW-Firmicutes-21]|nr:MAG: hypothetical protein CVU97_07410 [Firmicutes bacterium HGW-Firmicutes-21]
MTNQISDWDYNALKALYRNTFAESDAVAEEILGYARAYGEIRFLKEDGAVATMLCLTELENGLKYLFAAATNLDYRKKGLFAKNLSLSVNPNENVVCIPEQKELFDLYDRLGFTRHGYVLQVSIDGDGSFINKSNAPLRQLYNIYRNGLFRPKKPEELFYSTIRCHILYGGTVICGDDYYALCERKNGRSYIYELCVPAGEEERLPGIIKGCTLGETTVRLPSEYAAILKEHNIPYGKKKLFALKSSILDANDLYINLLYN